MKYQLKVSQTKLPRIIRRNRRLIAAGLFGLASLILLTELTANQSELAAAKLEIPTGKTAIAIELSSELIAQAITTGQQIDLISVTDGYATTVAQRAEILSIGDTRSRLGGSAIELLIAVTPTESTKVATANQDGSLQVLLIAAN